MTQGVIHDIGYQHYDGPRLGRRAITRALFLESAKAAYGLGRAAKSKIMPMLLLAAICLPPLIMVAITSFANLNELPGDYTTYILNAQPLVMIYVAGQAPASVSRDLRFGVMPLYFSRPMGRIDYVLAKYGALAVALFVFMALPLTILFLGALLAKLPLGEQLPDYSRSMAGAALLALVLAGLTLVIAAITPRRGLGIAAIMAVLVVLSGVQAATQGIAVETQHESVATYASLLSPFTLVHDVQHVLLGAKSVLQESPVPAAGIAVFLGATVLAIAGAVGALLLRYRKFTTS